MGVDGQKRTVFVIDDDLFQINWVRMAIEDDHRHVVSVSIDRQSIELAAARSEATDTFLIDI